MCPRSFHHYRYLHHPHFAKVREHLASECTITRIEVKIELCSNASFFNARFLLIACRLLTYGLHLGDQRYFPYYLCTFGCGLFDLSTCTYEAGLLGFLGGTIALLFRLIDEPNLDHAQRTSRRCLDILDAQRLSYAFILALCEDSCSETIAGP